MPVQNDTPLKHLVRKTARVIVTSQGNVKKIEKYLTLLARDLYEHGVADDATEAKEMAYGIFTISKQVVFRLTSNK